MGDMLSKKDKDTFCKAAAENEEKMMKALVNAVKKGMSKEAKKEKMEAMKEKMKAKKDEMEAKRKEKDAIVVSSVEEELVTLCPALQLRRALSEEKDKELAEEVSRIMRE